MKNYYNKIYFKWQSEVGEFGGLANLTKFTKYIRLKDNVIDFGCGGGYLLKNIKCKNKIGIDINATARKTAFLNGIKAVSSIKYIPNYWADVIISNNVLEHTNNPFNELMSLFPKLKKGGIIVFVVPCDSYKYKFDSHDINKHLYSWSPMNLGNIFTTVGYKVISVEPYLEKWPMFYDLIAKILGMGTFHLLSKINGFINTKWVQIRIIAKKT
jgi:2-polyprenyl-3-methyl-5-hydroxy-6-metoxy-1,4-benzoquinol methylase